MQVLASGQAGLFAVRAATGFEIERVDSGERQLCAVNDLAYHFAGCNDIEEFTVSSLEEARSRAERAWSTVRATRLFLMAIDPGEDISEIGELGSVLEDLLTEDDVPELVERQVFSCALPEAIAYRSIAEGLKLYPLTISLLERFVSFQSEIARVQNTFETIPDAEFLNEKARMRFRETAIDRGCIRSLVLAMRTSDGIDATLFQMYNDLKDFNNFRAIIAAWTASFGRHHDSAKMLVAEEEEYGEDEKHFHVQGGRDAYDRVIQQQDAIVDRIKGGDLGSARRFANDLVEQQKRDSSPQHIAKSLTKLSQIAKQFQVYDLALEWALRAAEFKSDDSKTHAQAADLYMRLNLFDNARQSLDLAETFGEAGYAASGRARILRQERRFEEALIAYRIAKERFGEDEDGYYSWAGVAETLRDLERLPEALVEYDNAITRFPFRAGLHSGRAGTLGELGRFEEALAEYKYAISLDAEDSVPRNGIATLYNKAGDWERAEAEFRSIIADHPFDRHSQVGLSITLREAGRVTEALAQAEATIMRFRSAPDAVWALADAQVESGEFDQAIATLTEGVADFSYSAPLFAALARVEKNRGRYSDALELFDRAAARFPSDPWIQVGRADMLRRLGNINEALRIYTRSLKDHPERLSLRNAMASIYLLQERYNDALSLLTVDNPRTKDEWRNFFLHGMLDAETGYDEAACRRFAWGAENCPFVRERRLLAAGLSRAQLRSGNGAAAIAAAELCTGDVTELVHFHAVAAQKDKGPARALYALLKESFLPERYHEVREEIARHFKVVGEPPRQTETWISQRESEALVLEAA